jgi:hypothetical protein
MVQKITRQNQKNRDDRCKSDEKRTEMDRNRGGTARCVPGRHDLWREIGRDLVARAYSRAAGCGTLMNLEHKNVRPESPWETVSYMDTWTVQAQVFHQNAETWPHGVFLSMPTRRPEDFFPAYVDERGIMQRVLEGDVFCRVAIVASAGPITGQTFYWHFRLSAEIFHALFTFAPEQP